MDTDGDTVVVPDRDGVVDVVPENDGVGDMLPDGEAPDVSVAVSEGETDRLPLTLGVVDGEPDMEACR